MRQVLAVLIMLLPWNVKRYIYQLYFNYELDPKANIGFSLVMPAELIMGESSRIGHLNVIKDLTLLSMGKRSTIGSLNWISGFPKKIKSDHFADQLSRSPKLIIGDHSAITNRHLIDCTDTVTIGRFSTFAGFRSQILTHSISVLESRQRSGPVFIGDYTFIGTSSIILPNTSLPNFSVLGAGAVLNKQHTEQYQLYAGNPARPVKKLDVNSAYFNRKTGYVI